MKLLQRPERLCDMEIHIYGCPQCGSEMSKQELKKAKREGFYCKYCSNVDGVEDYGIQNIPNYEVTR